MATERIDGSGILDALRDGFARASTEKQVQALADTVKGAMATLEERFSSIERRLKAAETRDEELVALIVKEFAKLRAHVTDQIETIETSEGDGEEVAETVKGAIDEVKGMVKFMIGDDPDTISAIRARIRGFVGKGGKKALGGGDEE